MARLDYLVGGIRRVIIASPTTGNFVDLGPNDLMEVGWSVDKRTKAMGDETEWVERATRTLKPVITHHDAVKLLRRMRRIDCGAKAVVVGEDAHLYIGSKCRVVDTSNLFATGQIDREQQALKTTAKYADVSKGASLLDDLPWEVSETQVADTLAILSIVTNEAPGAVDITSRGTFDGNLVGVLGGDSVYKILNSGFEFTGNSDLTDAQGIAWDGSNFWIVDNDSGSEQLVEVDTGGTTQTTTAYGVTSKNVGSASIKTGSPDLMYVCNKTDDQVDVVDLTSPGTIARNLTPDDGNTPVSVAVDGDDLLIGTSGGVVEVWDNTTTPESYQSTYDGSTLGVDGYWDDTQAWNGIELHNGVIFGLNTGTQTLDVVSRWQLGAPSEPVRPETVRSWRTRKTFSADIEGEASNISGRAPANVKLILPAWQADLRLVALENGSLSAEYKALQWDETVIQSGDATQTFTLPDRTWFLRLEVKSTTRRVELRVEDPGVVYGAVRGGMVADCTTRVSSPYWNEPSVVLTGEDV